MATHLHTVQVIVLFLLFLVAVFAAIAQRIHIPYPILLTLAGVAIAFVPHVPRIPLDPDLVFLIFLPPLLYAAAWQTNWREFRRNFVYIAMLAFGLVAFTVLGIAAFSDHFITAFDWRTGFLLGTVISTTDAVAASALASRIGLPQHVVEILEGESLINDATGLVALEFGLGLLLRDQAPGPVAGTLRFLWLLGGGIGIGLLIAVIVRWFERFIEDGAIEMAVSLIVPYGAYLAAEEARASGVLAVVGCGLTSPATQPSTSPPPPACRSKAHGPRSTSSSTDSSSSSSVCNSPTRSPPSPSTATGRSSDTASSSQSFSSRCASSGCSPAHFSRASSVNT